MTRYNFHSHTQWCDGHAPLSEMVAAAEAQGFTRYGVSPHSPVPLESPCNMKAADVPLYLDEMERLREELGARQSPLSLYAGMEIDCIGPDWGPHCDYFQKLPLDYRIGAVHFVMSQDGVPVDCDGSFARFSRNLRDAFRSDIRYVVEKYFESVLLMLEAGGFDILAHADKIAANASQASPGIEDEPWYEALIDDVVRLAVSSGVAVEINTKSFDTLGRFFPAQRWWPRFVKAGLCLPVDSDAHWPDRINAGRDEALTRLMNLKNSL